MHISLCPASPLNQKLNWLKDDLVIEINSHGTRNVPRLKKTAQTNYFCFVSPLNCHLSARHKCNWYICIFSVKSPNVGVFPQGSHAGWDWDKFRQINLQIQTNTFPNSDKHICKFRQINFQIQTNTFAGVCVPADMQAGWHCQRCEYKLHLWK